MTDITIMNSLSEVLNKATNRDSQANFQMRLVETLYPFLSGTTAAQFEPLIHQLPILVGRTEQESLDLYADSLRVLLEKQAAFTGSAADETVSNWMQSLQRQAVNGQITHQDVVTGVNNTLVHQFQHWFDKQLKNKVDSSLPTDFINEFRLGSQSTQAQQIAVLDASALKAATAEICKFTDALAQQLRTVEAREYAISFLRNAFQNLGTVDINGLKNSDYLLTQESFKEAITAQLVDSLGSIDVRLSSSDAKTLFDKITCIPGMSKQDLIGVLNDLVKQLQGQYKNVYEAGQVSQLQNVFNTEVANLNNSPNPITLSSLFSSIAVSLVNTQVDAFFSGLEETQAIQATPDQITQIKLCTAKDIKLLFEKKVARQNNGMDFTTRHKKMTENLNVLNNRLIKITQEETDNKTFKTDHALTAHDFLSVMEASIGDRFDDRVLQALNERRVDRLNKRNKLTATLKELTTRLKIYGVIQSKIHSMQSLDRAYKPGDWENTFQPRDFNYKNQTDFEASPEYKYLKDHSIKNHFDFLQKQGISIEKGASYKDDKNSKKLSNFSSSVSDKSKLLNDDVQIKTTELSDISSQYNATVEAMSKFVQKYKSILDGILRAI